MPKKSDAESMQELTSLMWSRFLKEQVRGELNHEMNAYKAEVVTNNGDGTLTVKRPFETVNLTLRAASSLQYAQPGDMVLVVGIGDKSKALSNAFILCKTDLSDDTDVPVYGMGENILDNWYFIGGGSQQGDGVFPINSRRRTSYPDTMTWYPYSYKYCIDRWLRSSTGTTVQVQSDGIVVGCTSGAAGWIKQAFQWDALKGKTMTYSVLYDDNGTLKLASGTGTFPTSPPSSSYTTVVLLNNQIPHGSGCGLYINSNPVAYVQVGVLTGYTLKVVAIKLELGSRQTLAHQENGTWVLNEIPEFNTELFKCKTDSALSEELDVYTNGVASINASNHNYVDNWYFAGGGDQQGTGIFPINQRGQSSYAAGTGYAFDRWRLLDGRTTAELQSDGLVLGNNSTGHGYMNQRIQWDSLKGKTVTYSVLWSDNGTLKLAYGTGILPTSVSSAVTIINFNNQFPHGQGCGLYVYASGGCSVQLGVASGYTVKIVAVKLELGAYQTLAHQENGAWVLNDTPDYWEELSKAQRYLRRISTAWRISYAARSDTNNVHFFIPGAMASNPATLTSNTVYWNEGIIQLTGNVTFTAVTDGVFGTVAKGSVPSNASGTVTFSANNVYISAEPT